MSHPTLEKELAESGYGFGDARVHGGFLEGLEAVKAGKLRLSLSAHEEYREFISAGRRLFGMEN